MNSAPDAHAAVDLILATVGRTDELVRCLRSLEAQSFQDFRVILVDQNDDDRLAAVLLPFMGSITLVHLRSRPGLSRARNAALAHLEGEIVGFPDDDCSYPPDLLARIVEALQMHDDWGGLSGRSIDERGRPSNMRWDRESGLINRFNIWRRAISYTVFLRRSVVNSTGNFAEELGVGSGTDWGSGEETDYLLRAIEAGFSLYYEPSITVQHAAARPDFTRAAARQATRSGRGNGRVLRLHRYPWWFAFYRATQLVGVSAFFLGTARPAHARFYFAMALGRVRGWLQPE